MKKKGGRKCRGRDLNTRPPDGSNAQYVTKPLFNFGLNGLLYESGAPPTKLPRHFNLA